MTLAETTWLQSASHRQTALLCSTPSISMHKNSQLQYGHRSQEPLETAKVRASCHLKKLLWLIYSFLSHFPSSFGAAWKKSGALICQMNSSSSAEGNRHLTGVWIRTSPDRGERAGWSRWKGSGGRITVTEASEGINGGKWRRKGKCQLLLEPWISKQSLSSKEYQLIDLSHLL